MGLKDDLGRESALSASSRLNLAADGPDMGIDNLGAELINPSGSDDQINQYLDDLERSLNNQLSPGNRGTISLGYNTATTSNISNTHLYSTLTDQDRTQVVRRHSDGIESASKDFVTSISVDNGLEMDTGLQLVWRNLSYHAVYSRWSFSSQAGQRKQILDKQSGQIKGGQITAIIGPSGAGKSSLLECLAGRRTRGLKGDVYVSYDKDLAHASGGVKLALIGQKDEAIRTLTVREVLTFATKVKNHYKARGVPHYTSRLVASVLKELSLEKCADTKVAKISGGQLKRLVFGVELISGPDIILLDEPTSGLDSSSAHQCVLLLKKLTDLRNMTYHSAYKAPSIICSIHQPSARVLNLFHQIYVLSGDGRCIYQGPPYSLLIHLEKFGLQCPQFHNPADFIIELASGDYGLDKINRLAQAESDRQLQLMKAEKLIAISDKLAVNFYSADNETAIQKSANQSRQPEPTGNRRQSNRIYVRVTKVIARMKRQRFPTMAHTWLLLHRTYITNFREPKLTWFRLVQAIFVGLLMVFLYDYQIGQPDGCYPIPIANKMRSTEDNIAFIFFITLFTVMASMMPTVLTFPAEVSVLLQERNNGWYSCLTYYVAKVLADTPIQMVITLVFVSIIYPLTGQIPEWHRFGLFCLVSLIISSIAQCIGIFFGTYYVRSVENAVFLAPLSMAPTFLLSGFFGKLSTIPFFLKPIAYTSYVRYAFESLLIILYGMDRCPKSPKSSATNSTLARTSRQTILNTGYVDANAIDRVRRKLILRVNPDQRSSFDYDQDTAKNLTLPEQGYNPIFSNETLYGSTIGTNGYPIELNGEGSYVLKHFELTDDLLWRNLAILIAFLILLRILCYLVLVWRTDRRK